MQAWFKLLEEIFPGMTIDEIQIMLATFFASIMPRQTACRDAKQNRGSLS